MFGKIFEKKHKLVIIAGASRFGARIAGLLSERNYDVIVIDKNRNAFSDLPDTFSGITVEGDAADISVLDSVQIQTAAACIAATGSDNLNSLIAQIAGSVYNIPAVYARLSDAERGAALAGSNVHIICPADLCLCEFERQSGLSAGSLTA